MSRAWRQLQTAGVAEAVARKAARSRPRHIEDGESMALMSWAAVRRYKGRLVSELLIHYPAGGRRNGLEAARLKRMGVRAGIPDYFLHVPVKGWAGLWIELKRPRARGVKAGATTEHQDEQLRLMASLGYRAEVAYGWQQAADIIADYLDLKRASA